MNEPDERPTPLEEQPVLVPARHAAEREQRRLAERAGRKGVAGMLAAASVRVRALGGADAAERGLRYQPAIWTVIGITAVAFWFPGADGLTGQLDASVVASPDTVPFAPPGTTPPVTVPTTVATSRSAAPALAAPVPVRPQTTRAPQVSLPAPTPGSPAPVPTVGTTDGSDQGDEVEVSVRGFGWFARGGGAVSTSPVPEGTMPVANRLGAEDKVSFVRLSGTTSTLVLREDPDGASEALGPAAVRLCVVEDASWEEQPGQAIEDAPPWSDTCAAGQEVDGTWRFDLTGMGDPDAATGFALVPGGDAPLEFQITFVA